LELPFFIQAIDVVESILVREDKKEQQLAYHETRRRVIE